MKLLLADEYPLSRRGMRSLLDSYLLPAELTEADSFPALLQELTDPSCTHLFTDTLLKEVSIVEQIPLIRQTFPALQIMIYFRDTVPIQPSAFRQFDIHYCLSKSASPEETRAAISRFLRNEAPNYPYDVPSIPENPFSILAPRESEIMHHIIRGERTLDIARQLGVKVNTISTVKRRIFEKTATSNESELIKLSTLYNIPGL